MDEVMELLVRERSSATKAIATRTRLREVVIAAPRKALSALSNLYSTVKKVDVL